MPSFDCCLRHTTFRRLPLKAPSNKCRNACTISTFVEHGVLCARQLPIVGSYRSTNEYYYPIKSALNMPESLVSIVVNV